MLAIGTGGALGPVVFSTGLVYDRAGSTVSFYLPTSGANPLLPAGSAAQCWDATGALCTRATPPQHKRIQTDSSGNYTWTFDTPFSAAPQVSVVPEGGSIVPILVQITSAPTTTSVTFKVWSLPSTSILGIATLGAPVGAQAWLQLAAFG